MLRGSNRTSTLEPDADNAAVGSHDMDFFTGGIRTVSPVFCCCFQKENRMTVESEKMADREGRTEI